MLQSKKHAYLIMAHANPYVLEKLIRLLDDARNDIYIHIDKKNKSFDFQFFQSLTTHSSITFIDRIDTRWGHISLVEAELKLMEIAYTNAEQYSYYHLISGTDLPIQSQNYIHRFFEQNSGYEFIGLGDAVLNLDRVKRIHLFAKNMRATENEIGKRIKRKIRLLFIKLQKQIGYEVKNDRVSKFVYGSQWVSVTHGFVGDLLQEKKWIEKFYKYSNCGDEIYKQTFACNSVYKEKIYDPNNELRGCMRYMDWQRGRPYTFRIEDMSKIINSDRLFARKFEDAIDTDIVDAIYQEISNRK